MGKGGYTGGSTTFGRGSDWFSYRKSKGKPRHLQKHADDPRPIQDRIAEAADRLAAAKAEFDRGEWTADRMPPKVKRRRPIPPKPMTRGPKSK